MTQRNNGQNLQEFRESVRDLRRSYELTYQAHDDLDPYIVMSMLGRTIEALEKL